MANNDTNMRYMKHRTECESQMERVKSSSGEGVFLFYVLFSKNNCTTSVSHNKRRVEGIWNTPSDQDDVLYTHRAS